MSVADLYARPGDWLPLGTRKTGSRTRKPAPKTGALKKAKSTRKVVNRAKKERVGFFSTLHAGLLFLVRLLGWLAAVVLVMLLLGAISLGLVYGYRGLMSSEHFAVSEVNIVGNRQLSSAEVLNLSGISRGMNILEVSLADMSQSLRGNPWIENVTVRRQLPDQISIEVQEREPLFWVQQAGTMYYADRNGSPIAPLELGRFVSLPTLILDQAKERSTRILQDWVQSVERLEYPFGFSEIAWLMLEDANMLVIYLEDRAMHIHFDLSDPRQHRDVLGLVWEDLQKRQELDRVARLTVMSGKAWIQEKQP